MLLCLVVSGKMMIIIDLNPDTFMIELLPIFKRYMALKKTTFFFFFLRPKRSTASHQNLCTKLQIKASTNANRGQIAPQMSATFVWELTDHLKDFLPFSRVSGTKRAKETSRSTPSPHTHIHTHTDTQTPTTHFEAASSC